MWRIAAFPVPCARTAPSAVALAGRRSTVARALKGSCRRRDAADGGRWTVNGGHRSRRRQESSIMINGRRRTNKRRSRWAFIVTLSLWPQPPSAAAAQKGSCRVFVQRDLERQLRFRAIDADGGEADAGDVPHDRLVRHLERELRNQQGEHDLYRKRRERVREPSSRQESRDLLISN